MVKWYKRDELNKALPNKKADLLICYRETCDHGDQTAQTLPSALEQQLRLEESPSIQNEDGGTTLLEPLAIEQDDENEEETLTLAV
jgi:hypothetical protein